MTPTADLAALNEWNPTPEMFQSLPDLMFAIAAGDGLPRERIAAARVLLAIDKQNISRAGKKRASPPIVEIVHMDLQEDVCEEVEQVEPSPSDLIAEETDIGIGHPADADHLPTIASCPAESISPGRASLSSEEDESLPHTARSGHAAGEEEAADRVGEAHPEDLPCASMASQSRDHSTRRGELSICAPITARGHPSQDPIASETGRFVTAADGRDRHLVLGGLSEGQFFDPLQLRRLGPDVQTQPHWATCVPKAEEVCSSKTSYRCRAPMTPT